MRRKAALEQLRERGVELVDLRVGGGASEPEAFEQPGRVIQLLRTGEKVRVCPQAVAAFAEGLDQDAEAVTLYLALRELAHARLFRHTKWLRLHLMSAIGDYARGIRIDTDRISDMAIDIDPSDPSKIQELISNGALIPPKTEAQEAAHERLETMLALVDEMPKGAGIREFAEELVARQKTQHEPTLDAVTLCAIHAAKGLEWDMVHVVGLSEGILPIVHAEDEEAIDEERRLCYVAFTRARDVLRLSGSAGGARTQRLPSRFVAEAGIAV